ncbi:MAG: hypothetical protein IPG63_07590 [Xanthomonadales bacterium]|nr:hypothetical protein [Xanthomonadales bacterium]MCC6562126.1 hypothetical protein [Xanthomonadales bacterium]
MKITQARLPEANAVITLATSDSSAASDFDAHEFLSTRGVADSGEHVDLLFVVAEASDPLWPSRTADLCRRATLALVQPMVCAEKGANQFPAGPTIYHEWMLRFFDALLVTDAAPLDVLRHCVDFLSPGVIGTDFADLHACLADTRILCFHRVDGAPDHCASDMIARDAGLRSQLQRASHILAVTYGGDTDSAFAPIKYLGTTSPNAMVVAQSCPRPADALPSMSLLLAETRKEHALIGRERPDDQSVLEIERASITQRS